MTVGSKTKEILSPKAAFELTRCCLSSEVLNQFIQRDLVKKSCELRPIISNDADVIDNRILDHPLCACAMRVCIRFYRSPLATNHPRVHFCSISIYPVAVVNHFFAPIRAECTHIRVFNKIGERRHKFLLLAVEIIPAFLQRLLSHGCKIKAAEKNLSQRLSVSLNVPGL